MGFLDFFKRKSSEENQKNISDKKSTFIDNNTSLLEVLKQHLAEKGYDVKWHQQYQAIVINSELEIATAIIENPNYHPLLIHLMILTIHPKYFKDGIEENIVGVGNTIEEKVESVLNNYLSSTFEPIIDSFTDSHNPALDFYVNEILWHPKLGNINLQGDWETEPEHDSLFNLLKDIIPEKLSDNKINWLKIYISKNQDTITAECLFNNKPWEEGLNILNNYAKNWQEDDFKGIKQFIMFRKCDKYD